MKKYLYEDLYKIENTHWWCQAKTDLCVSLIKNYCVKDTVLKILELGCGTGRNMEVLSNIGIVWGIDMASEAIKFCRKRDLKRVKRGIAEDTGYRTNFFDVVVALDVIEHTDDKKTLQEVRRILKPDGLLIITVPAFRHLWSRWDVVLQHRRRYTKKDLINILSLYNFVSLKVSYLYSYLFIPALIVRSIKSRIYSSDYPSDFLVTSPFFDWFFFNFYKFEKWLLNFINIPFGTSVFAIARNRKNHS